jgi:hypothetical protein
MLQLCGMLKNPEITWMLDCLAKFDRPFLAHVPVAALRHVKERRNYVEVGLSG